MYCIHFLTCTTRRCSPEFSYLHRIPPREDRLRLQNADIGSQHIISMDGSDTGAQRTQMTNVAPQPGPAVPPPSLAGSVPIDAAGTPSRVSDAFAEAANAGGDQTVAPTLPSPPMPVSTQPDYLQSMGGSSTTAPTATAAPAVSANQPTVPQLQNIAPPQVSTTISSAEASAGTPTESVIQPATAVIPPPVTSISTENQQGTSIVADPIIAPSAVAPTASTAYVPTTFNPDLLLQPIQPLTNGATIPATLTPGALTATEQPARDAVVGSYQMTQLAEPSATTLPATVPLAPNSA